MNLTGQAVESKILNDIFFLSKHESISLTTICHGAEHPPPKSLLDSAMLLNHYPCPNKPISAKPIRMNQIDTRKFHECLVDTLELFKQITDNTENVCSIITEPRLSAC